MEYNDKSENGRNMMINWENCEKSVINWKKSPKNEN